MQTTNCFSFKPVKNKKIQQAIEQNKKELDNFFGVDYALPKIFLLNSRKDMDAYKGYKTPDWLAGTANGDMICIFQPDKHIKVTSHKKMESYWKLIKHEQCHLYYRSFVKTSEPVWLNEGVSIYFANQKWKTPDIQTLLKVVDLKKYNNWKSLVYPIGHFWVNFLIDNFGKDKFFKFLNEISKNGSENNFNKIFYKIYKIKFNKTELKKLIT